MENAIIDIKDKNGETPLFMAVRNGHTQVVDILLKQDADPEIANFGNIKLIDAVCEVDLTQMDHIRELFAFLRKLGKIFLSVSR